MVVNIKFSAEILVVVKKYKKRKAQFYEVLATTVSVPTRNIPAGIPFGTYAFKYVNLSMSPGVNHLVARY